MGILTYVKSVFYPPRCAACRSPLDISRSSPFCIDCQYELSKASCRRCVDCGLDIHKCTCVLPVLRAEGFSFHVKLFGYSTSNRKDTVNKLIYTMKSSQRRELYDWLAMMLEKDVSNAVAAQCSTSSLVPLITYVPRSGGSVARYGFDQAELLARALSRRLSIPVTAVVRRKNLTDAEMKRMNAASRFAAGANAFEPIFGCGAGKNTLLIIVDDVVTSGASVYWTAQNASNLGVTNFAAVSVAKTI